MTPEDFGKAVGRGFLGQLSRWIVVWLLAFIVIQALIQAVGYGYDSTDNYDARERSGVRLRMDHGTGCQYLEARSGGLTPRLDRNGKQVCRP